MQCMCYIVTHVFPCYPWNSRHLSWHFSMEQTFTDWLNWLNGLKFQWFLRLADISASSHGLIIYEGLSCDCSRNTWTPRSASARGRWPPHCWGLAARSLVYGRGWLSGHSAQRRAVSAAPGVSSQWPQRGLEVTWTWCSQRQDPLPQCLEGGVCQRDSSLPLHLNLIFLLEAGDPGGVSKRGAEKRSLWLQCFPNSPPSLCD